jgi:predicted  nucleic acid-binding Zn-ribbon protein
LQAQLNEDISSRGEADDRIDEKTEEIAEHEKELKELEEEHAKVVLKFEKEEVDLTGALVALDGAIQAMKASKTAVSLAQLKPVAQTVSRALVIAEALGVEPKVHKSTKQLVSLLEAPVGDADTYSFQGGDIIETLEDLRTTFRDNKNELLETHIKDKHEFDVEKLDLNGAIELAESALERSKKDKATLTSRIASASQDLSTVSANLLDDQSYLAALSKKCNEKAVLWDERVQGRADELQALTQAIDIMKSDTVQGKGADGGASSFLQLSEVRKVETHVRMINRHRTKQHRQPAPLGRRARIITLLKAKATELKSESLMNLATVAAGDPFGKIRTLIEELIERLLHEAAEEANHKGWCDKETALAKQERDHKHKQIEELNSRIAVNEGRIAKLTESVDKLEEDLAALAQKVGEQEQLREEEKEENEKRIDEAKDARDAVAEAIDTLEKYYKTAAKNGFVQVSHGGKTIDGPDAGFDGGYEGNQGGGSSVLGMLDVVKSDFERTISETEKEEEDAKQAHTDFMTTSGKSRETKTVAKEQDSQALDDANTQDEEDRASLESATDALNKALGELNSLHKACVDNGQSAEERAAAREEEISALKQALCILEAHGSDAAAQC